MDKCTCESVKGLGLIPGTVGRFDSSNGFRVPHIGWNALQITKDSEILDDVGNHHVYFVHSYRAMPVCFHFSLEISMLLWLSHSHSLSLWFVNC
jgi:imidazoleglycerol phosphate synthase glutamine amidotransferase subunit HisH